jgi:hypothetical protein
LGQTPQEHSGKGQADGIVAHAEISMAKTDSRDPHQDFVMTRFAQLQGLDLEIRPWPLGDRGPNLHAISSHVQGQPSGMRHASVTRIGRQMR